VHVKALGGIVGSTVLRGSRKLKLATFYRPFFGYVHKVRGSNALVIDTNQIDSVRKLDLTDGCVPTLVLPAMTWAEVLAGSASYAKERIEAIAQYELRFGLEASYCYGLLCRMNEDEIQQFDPVVPVDSVDHRKVLKGLLAPTAAHLLRAKELKDIAATESQAL
jgi:hypothetical protein